MVLDVVTIITFAFGGADKIQQKQEEFKSKQPFICEQDTDWQQFHQVTNMNTINEEPASQETSVDLLQRQKHEPKKGHEQNIAEELSMGADNIYKETIISTIESDPERIYGTTPVTNKDIQTELENFKPLEEKMTHTPKALSDSQEKDAFEEEFNRSQDSSIREEASKTKKTVRIHPGK